MVYGTYYYSCGGYKPTHNWGGTTLHDLPCCSSFLLLKLTSSFLPEALEPPAVAVGPADVPDPELLLQNAMEVDDPEPQIAGGEPFLDTIAAHQIENLLQNACGREPEVEVAEPSQSSQGRAAREVVAAAAAPSAPRSSSFSPKELGLSEVGVVKTARSICLFCREPIPKGDIRFSWYHSKIKPPGWLHERCVSLQAKQCAGLEQTVRRLTIFKDTDGLPDNCRKSCVALLESL